MDTRFLMAKMTAHGLVITDVRGGQAVIGMTDVAAALAMGDPPLSSEAYVMGRVKYCDDELYLQRLERVLFWRLKHLAGREPPRGVVRVCLREGIWRPVHRNCEGRGCPRCDGTGLKRFTHRERARFADVGKDSWRRHWSGPVDRVVMNMDGWSEECLHHLYVQFLRGEPPAGTPLPRAPGGRRVAEPAPARHAEGELVKTCEESFVKKSGLYSTLTLNKAAAGPDNL